MLFLIIEISSLMATFLFLDEDSSGAAAAPLALCLAGFIYFAIIYLRYRNSDKRHHHEAETPATIQNLQQYDQFVKHRKRQRNRSMKGRNDQQIEGALNDGGGVLKQLSDLKGSLK